MHIMIIEDDAIIRKELASFLTEQGYSATIVTRFEDVVKQVITLAPHLILLDINLPYFDGYFLCKEIRKQCDIPIIIVTSRNSQMDELMSMNLGADDFITKPYHIPILLARIEALLKRTYGKGNEMKLIYNGLMLDLSNLKLSYQGESQVLSKNEIKILHYLMMHQGKIVTREELMESLWSTDIFIDDNTLSVNMTRLRKKIEEMGMNNPIETRRGIGYIMP